MLTYLDFYSLVKYCNENWKSGFTEEEVALNAYDYLIEFERSVKLHKCTDVIYSLINKLRRYNTEESNRWWRNILFGVGEYIDFNEKEYEVEIVETYRRRVKVRAADEDEAYEIIDEKVNAGEIDLPGDGEDYKYNRELYVSEVKENE